MKTTVTQKTTIYILAVAMTLGCKKNSNENTPPIPSNTHSTTSGVSNNDDNNIKQLYCEDLREGDIMLKIADMNNTRNRQIRFVQKWTNKLNYNITHAGIMKSKEGTTDIIIEAAKSGLEEHSLRGKNAHVGYIVYRAVNPQLAAGAATAASLLYDIHKAKKSVRYNKKGLFPSVLFGDKKPKSAEEMDEILDKILSGHNNPMFCSQFVVYSYQWASTQMGMSEDKIFNVNDSRVSPAKLAEMLQGNPNFTEVGYLIGNEH